MIVFQHITTIIFFKNYINNEKSITLLSRPQTLTTLSSLMTSKKVKKKRYYRIPFVRKTG